MPTNELVITTSQSIEGCEIVEHLDVVSAQVVQGAGAFSGFIAGFTDFFGGRSLEFQRHLDSARDAVIKLLREKVARIGGNAVVGFHLDFDEISGKNTLMFMVSAYGMAVVIKKPESMEESRAPRSTDAISSQALDRHFRANAYMHRINEGSLTLDDRFWRFISENQIPAFIPWAFDFLAMRWKPKTGDHMYTANTEEAFAYLRRFGGSTLSGFIYSEIDKPTNWGLILGFAAELGLVDYALTLQMLSSSPPREMARLLSLLAVSKARYTMKDVDDMRAICALLAEKYVRPRNLTEVKKLIGTKVAWTCPSCGKGVEQGTVHCPSCGVDWEGFREGESNYTETLSQLKMRASAVEGLLLGSPKVVTYTGAGLPAAQGTGPGEQPALEHEVPRPRVPTAKVE